MRRTDRLFDLLQILRDGKLHTAQEMAKTLGVSVRTIYRDMETLQMSGVPVEGERGVVARWEKKKPACQTSRSLIALLCRLDQRDEDLPTNMPTRRAGVTSINAVSSVALPRSIIVSSSMRPLRHRGEALRQ